MAFDLKQIQELAEQYKNPEPLGIEFLDQRVEGMRNPDGHVASYYRFFYALAKQLKPSTIVELGGWQGTSAAHFAAGSPSSLVITVDHHTDPGDDYHKGKMLRACEEYKNLIYCQGWTCDELYKEQKDIHSLGEGQNAYPKVLKALAGRKIDVLFIDSWHEYTQAKKDWEAYKGLLSSPALVICDDICKGNPGEGIDNMVKFWEEMPGEKWLCGWLHSGYPMGFVKL